MKHTNRWLALFVIMAVSCLCGCSKSETAVVTEPTVMVETEPATTAVPVEEKEGDLLPWENGGKKPEEYTWAEYEALTVYQKEAFFDSFGSSVEFDAWMSRVTGSSVIEPMPWEDGGKQPKEYTWAEYEVLTTLQKEAFFDSFENDEAFDDWMRLVAGRNETVETKTEQMLWEKDGKQPEEYTWAEYKDLTASQKEEFFDSFASAEAFDDWMNRESSTGKQMPWEKGRKQPEEYTWAEYQALSASRKEAFYDSFESADAFDAWMNRVTSGTEKMPWENGGKQPENYTWAEYEALTVFQKEAFFDSFDDVKDFESWLTANQN